MATVDEDGNPQVRIISVMHVDDEKLYFLTARGKPFFSELLRERKIAVLGLSKFNEMIRLNGVPELLPEDIQSEWIDLIFNENPYLGNTYPGTTREVLEVFCIAHGEIAYFHLGVHPIVHEVYTIGDRISNKKKYQVTDLCTGCSICLKHCPQKCIETGNPHRIVNLNCLCCGLCKEKCPSQAIIYQ